MGLNLPISENRESQTSRTGIDSGAWLTEERYRDFEGGLSRMEAHRRRKRGDPHFVVSKPRREFDGKPGWMINAHSMSFDAQERWRKSLLQNAGKPKPDATNPPSKSHHETLNSDLHSSTAPAQLDLLPRTEIDEKVAALKIPDSQRGVILRRFKIVQVCLNYNWKAEGYQSRNEYLTALAERNETSVRSIRRWRNAWKEREDLRDLADERPGPEPGAGAILDADMRAHLLDCFLRRLKWRQCWRSLEKYLVGKQNRPGCSVDHEYQIPSRTTVERFIRDVLVPKYAPQREGADAIKRSAGYIDRAYDEHAGDCLCLDEWEVDAVFFDEERHDRIFNYGAGRPIVHILTILDERTTCLVDHLVTWQLSLEDGVFVLAERVIRNHFLPLRFVSDRAGRFRALVRGHIVIGTDGDLVKRLAGPLGELGVEPRGSEEKNPRANRLERLHRLYADRAREFGVSWKPPLQKHEHREVDDAVRRHLHEHCYLGTLPPQLISIQEAERRIAKWVEEINLAETKAKGCKGMTRLAAFRQFQPPAAQVAERKPNPQIIDLAFAEKDKRAVREGGIVELKDGARYSSPLLIEHVGEVLPVLRYRREPMQLIVAPEGEEPIVAERRAIVGTKDEELLAQEIEKLARVRKILAGPGPRPDQEISGAAYIMERETLRGRGKAAHPPTSSDLAEQILKMDGAG